METNLSEIEYVANIAIKNIQACDTAIMDREDLRQEALLGALQAEGRYDGRGGKRAWLLRRANGACIDAIRKMSYGTRNKDVSVVRLQDPVGEDHTLEDFLACDRPSPMDEGFKQILKARMLGLMENLSVYERSIISLFYFEDLSLTDAARIIGIRQPRASMIHKTALAKLRSLLVVSKFQLEKP